MRSPTLQLKNITRTFQQGEETISVLKQINLEIYPGEIIALVGTSGAGKTTLLQIAGLLELPTSGMVTMDKCACNELDDQARTLLRRQHLGFVYQFHHLLPEFTALENVMLPQLIAGETRSKAKSAAEELLNRMGLGHRLNHRPKKLSGGEQQRVAIARALANKPKILLADEPTGNLDNDTAKIVFDEMLSLVRHSGLSALIATHNLELAQKMDRVIKLQGGALVSL